MTNPWHIATVSSKGQVTVTLAIRRRLGIGPGTRLSLTLVGDELQCRPVNAGRTRGRARTKEARRS